MTPTKAIEHRSSAALVKGTPARAVLAELAAGVPESDEDEDIGEVIIARILNAETIEDALTPSSAPGMRDIVDVPIVVHDIRRKNGGQNPEMGFYLLAAVEIQGTGEQAVMSTGATNVVAQLLKAYQLGSFPLACKILEVESKSNPGRMVQWLVNLDNF